MGNRSSGPAARNQGPGHFGQRNLLIALPKAHSCLSKNTPQAAWLALFASYMVPQPQLPCFEPDKPRLPQHLQSLFMLTSRNLQAKRHSVAGKVHIMAESNQKNQETLLGAHAARTRPSALGHTGSRLNMFKNRPSCAQVNAGGLWISLTRPQTPCTHLRSCLLSGKVLMPPA